MMTSPEPKLFHDTCSTYEKHCQCAVWTLVLTTMLMWLMLLANGDLGLQTASLVSSEQSV